MQSLKTFALLGLLLAGLTTSGQAANNMASGPNPISKVMELISGLQAKVVAEGEAGQKGYEQFAEWCEDTSKEKSFEIKTHKGEVEDLAATIEKADSDIETFSSKVEDLSGVIGTDAADLKAATLIRAKERSDFEAEARMLSDTIDTLSRAQSVLEKELGGSALIQQDSAAAVNAAQAAKPFISALRTILAATSLSSEDKTKLTALMQENQGSEDNTDAQMLGAPAAANYENHSSGIIDTIADMQEKAEAELDEKQKAELKAKQNFELLKQSLEDQINANQKELDETKKSIAEAEETKAAATGELEATQKDLTEVEKTLADVHADCMARATTFEGAVQERNAELEALAAAKKIIQETTGGASDRSYAADFLQTGMKTHTRAKAHAKAAEAMKQYRAVKIVKNLARKMHSMVLAQLADRVAEALRSEAEGTTTTDPFAKVKGMISEMIEKLVKEAQEEATKKAYCDKEMSKTKKSKEEGETAVEDLTTKIDKAEAKIAKLKQEVAELQRELAELAESQAKMDAMRQSDNATYKEAKADLEQGLSGVEMAMKVLKDYYAKSDDATALVQDAASRSVTEMMQERTRAPATGAASGIIGMLEVAASDFSKNLADIEAEESAAAEEYDRQTKDNEVTRAEKQQDVKYKKKERKSLEKIVSEAKEDRDGVQSELNAVLEYYAKLKPECIAKPEPYEERKRRREEEIAGLKEAASILEGEAVFLQIGSTKQHHLRGIQSA